MSSYIVSDYRYDNILSAPNPAYLVNCRQLKQCSFVLVVTPTYVIIFSRHYFMAGGGVVGGGGIRISLSYI